MTSLDLKSSAFWLLLSSAGFVGSLRMGIGSAESPGMGFMPAVASGLLGILSLILLTKTIVKRLRESAKDVSTKISRKSALVVLSSILIYLIILPGLGYLSGTFLLMTFLYWFMEQNGVRGLLRAVVMSLITTLASYYLFAVLLNCPFPKGIFGF